MTQAWTVLPVLGVPNVAPSAAFFVDQLGFELPYGMHGPKGHEIYAIVRRGDIGVALQQRNGPSVPSVRGGEDNDVYFTVPDVDALRGELAAKNVSILRDLQDQPYGLRDFVLVSPDGHRLTFGTEMPPRDAGRTH